jgi:hypothetical protein
MPPKEPTPETQLFPVSFLPLRNYAKMTPIPSLANHLKNVGYFQQYVYICG